MIRWLKRIVLALLVLVIAGFAVLWVGSERILHRSYAGVVVAAPKLAGNAESGKHWAAILGCSGCHGPTLHGTVIFPGSFLFGALVAPNLTIRRKLYDDAKLARMIRFGIRHDGSGVELMPSHAFWHLDEQTVADLIAFVRSVPDDATVQPESSNGPVTRWNFLTGVWKLEPELVPRDQARLGDAPHAQGIDRGRYIATVACGECHGLDQKGDPDGGVPNLAVAKAYTLDEFKALMHSGVGKGGRKVGGMMAGVAKWRFSAFTDDEIADLKAFLDAREP